MSPLPSGNENLNRSFIFEVSESSQVGEVRRQAQELANLIEMSEIRATRLSIVANELSTNLSRHAKQGQIILRIAQQFGESYVEIISVDRGPGIGDLAQAFTDGYTSGTTPGTGLGAVRRQSDLVDVYSSDAGTILVSEIHASDESAERAKSSCFRLSAICLPVHGENVAGDTWTARETHDGFDLIVIDGLGHGPLANAAARAALDSFDAMETDLTLDQKLKLLHGALRVTRGAAISIANLSPNRMRGDLVFAGVGNVRGVICEREKDRTLITHPGTVGLQFRPHLPVRTKWDGHGAFVMHSDGLQQRWNSSSRGAELSHHPAIFAASLFRDYNRGNDDITVAVCRYGEGSQYT